MHQARLVEQVFDAGVEHAGKGFGMEADPEDHHQQGCEGENLAQPQVPNEGMVGIARAALGDLLQHPEHIGGSEHDAGDDADHPEDEAGILDGELEPATQDQEFPDEAVRAREGQGG